MPNMGYLDPSYHQYHDQMNTMSPYEAQMHNYMTQQNSSMMTMPPAKTNETKPRLGKDEVDILEREFKKNPKPTTQVKRGFAEDMGVDLARINNWFQNRRAKRKQEKKQEAYEAGQAQEALGFSDNASSPDFFHSNSYYNDIQQQPASFSLLAGHPPPPPVASYNPQYADPSGASMESLHRSMAQAASHHDFHNNNFLEHNDSRLNFGDSYLHDSPHGDRAQFPAPDNVVSHFENNESYSFPTTFANGMYSSSPQSFHDVESSPVQTTNQTPTPYSYSNSSSSDSNGSQTLSHFPSQLLSQSHDGLPALTADSSDTQSPEESSESHVSLDFKYDVTGSQDNEMSPPPAPSIPFKASAPMDIASRRKKVHVKPAALAAETLRNRPSMGPRTVSNADGFRRGVDSPMGSPMRRIVSAGGNRSNAISGRICKPSIESAQRSPINLGGFSDAGAFMEHNFHSIRNPPSLTALSSLNSSLAPPTPMSPREREMTLRKESARSTASPHEGSMNFVFNNNVPSCFTNLDSDQNLASPPETPHAHLILQQPPTGWPTNLDYPDKQWSYDVSDEPLYTPAHDNFPLELQMPQPTYLSTISQPVTPAFGHFNPALIFGAGTESPRFKESPQYALPTQTGAEYTFPDAAGQGFGMGMGMGTLTSPLSKQKTFQFSNTTAADFSEK
ncbi:hypothetical protein HYFRA_00010415 [Hymenoscyphus fraxineus]|uniref:Homeobox domain-containing protein n=1 Tax=Hymenoscyphus fraxineus TaxID=746836 RepID=A0A9N9L1U3_9HELO|nr:hypothetical protein HYFRA_00010415 [Hymenoscyphus fraxineus]